MKYAAPNTKVTISGKWQSNKLIIHIRNIGYPILPGEEKLVFEEKWRAPLAKRKGISGHGLGLTYARDIMRQHGGDILTSPSRLVVLRNIPSEQSYLTTFEIVIPVEEGKK